MSVSSSSATTSNSRREESFSVFGDGACGEPLSTQHLVMDFTPSEEIDTDFVQRKCCTFWDFIKKNPQCRGLMVMPEPLQYNDAACTTSASTSSASSEASSSESTAAGENTALSMLQFSVKKGLIGSKERRLSQPCSLGSREYIESPSTAKHNAAAPRGNKSVCSCHGTCKMCRPKEQKKNSSSSPELQVLCKKLRDWDSDHPKSMAPPGHAPGLTDCLLQRKIIS